MQICTCLTVHAEAKRGPGGLTRQGAFGKFAKQNFQISIRLSDSNVVNRMKFTQVETIRRPGEESQEHVLKPHFTLPRARITEHYDTQVQFSMSLLGLPESEYQSKLPASIDTILSIELEDFLEWEIIIQKDITLTNRHKLVLDWPDIELNPCKTWRLPFRRVWHSPEDPELEWEKRFGIEQERLAQERKERKKLLPIMETPPSQSENIGQEMSKNADSLRTGKKQSKKGLMDNLFKKSTLSG